VKEEKSLYTLSQDLSSKQLCTPLVSFFSREVGTWVAEKRALLLCNCSPTTELDWIRQQTCVSQFLKSTQEVRTNYRIHKFKLVHVESNYHIHKFK